MRILAKILLFPVVLVLTILVAVCRFISAFSGVVLGIFSFIVFLIAPGTIFILHDVRYGITALIMAYAISPFGIPLFVSWLVDRLDDLKYTVKSI